MPNKGDNYKLIKTVCAMLVIMTSGIISFNDPQFEYDDRAIG